VLPTIAVIPLFLRCYCLDVWLIRMRLISRWGGAPNNRLYSRLNCDTLS
jgi:hypothetical protein